MRVSGVAGVGWALSALAPLSAVALAACFGGGPRLLAPEDAGVAAPVDFADSAIPDASNDVDVGDPFAVLGLQPSHGPWSGGTHTVIRGRGFTSSVQVFVGGKEVEPSAIVASDPTRISIVTPSGATGPADVTVKNVSTADARTLTAGFYYDAFSVTPNSGAATGGTRVRLEGSGTAFADGATVTFAGAAATDVSVKSAMTSDRVHLARRRARAGRGRRDVAGAAAVTARDAAFGVTNVADPAAAASAEARSPARSA
ncbi:MAG: IPT/TIG domain-containing protein [Polyangiaceae bacterium]